MLTTAQSRSSPRHPDATNCPACVDGTLEAFFEIAQVPILCNILCDTREQALAVPLGDMRLGFCRACGHIYNAAFDPQLMNYNAAYENALQFSPRFREYLDSLARNLIEEYGLRDKNIIEIGCGQGDFLSLLCGMGGNRGLGFDPSFDAAKAQTSLDAGVEIVPQHYCHAHADRPVDLLCCRHVLEHIPRPLEFVREIRRTIGDRREVLLFFEVPNALFTLDGLAIWDLIYEHCSYFTPSSLRRVFEIAGFEVLAVEAVYGGQFLTITARPASGSVNQPPDTSSLTHSIRRFSEEYHAKVALWRQRRDQLHAQGRRAVIWGAGSKGVTFLNVLRMDYERMPCAIDLNPRKHGRFVVGTGQEIAPPHALVRQRPDMVIVMNAIYHGEISAQLRSLRVEAQVLSA